MTQWFTVIGSRVKISYKINTGIQTDNRDSHKHRFNLSLNLLTELQSSALQ